MTRAIQVLRTVQQVRQWRRQCLLNKESVGFVPTMGALHAGHCHLVHHSIKDNDRTVVSIFVNPSQFAPHEDLDAYPRTLDRDLAMLDEQFSEKPVDAVFVPKILELYPSGIVLEVEKQKGAFVTVQGFSEQLEGALRPAFFRGVATVVTKLLNVVTPDRVYFGQKDAQQCVVIKNLVKDLLIDTKVEILDTLREPNGLAMLSRNEYLSPETKDECTIIYQGLVAARTLFAKAQDEGMSVTAQAIREAIDKTYQNMPQDWKIDYVAISHPETLDELVTVDKDIGATVSVAVRVPKEDGTVARLIDNVQLK
ncbi:Pantoate-beta-alanine ligase [Metschnikowia bicuspidata var. bicuspidata NRRL YB-4993]|uniref:Pantoate--beta-alanine ligase n=1 Tax=Metschnikowia bicuspidata var. bicuspidata NRRL YB-4993 TaxID=869754 RepID=A0A1A0HB84_9ASCO|nr:Pantoate-beta-alanine ligase [Metschnikowia bicuspidata var. bicuspidata NRRL YB-4993]OBA21137.1 Pantoate-beta-alanine ligase [Metschnikowia bicuspidata var. bicuspidata NRRL YB-4993]